MDILMISHCCGGVMKGLIKIVSIIGLIAVAGIMAGCSKAENELHVYSIIHEEETKALTDLFT